MNSEIFNKINKLEKKINILNDKIDLILDILNKDIKQNCNKMAIHIDFIETIYENVKNPLGFICNRLNYYVRDNKYNLEDKSN